MKLLSTRILSGFYILTAAAALSACGGTEGAGHEGHDHAHEAAGVDAHSEISLTPEQIRTVDIRLGKVEKRAMGSTVNLSGVLEVNPSDAADVSSLWSGAVRSIPVVEGTRVGAGSVLATIENTEVLSLQQDYREALASLGFAEKELKRQRALAAEGAGVRRNLEQAESEERAVRARADGLAARLRQGGVNPADVASGRFVTTTAITSPIAGVVTKVNAVKGSYAQPGTVLFTVVNTSGIYARVNLFEKDLPLVETGDVAHVTLTNGESGTMEGKVADIVPGVNAETRAVSARISLPPAKGLMPGMAVTAAVEHSSVMADALPRDAVAQVEGKSYIFVLKDKSADRYVFTPVEVKTGASSGDYVQITPAGPLADTATVVTANAFYIASMVADHGEHNH